MHAAGTSWTREARTANGLYSAHDPRLFFGLGDVTGVERIEIRWPRGNVDLIEAPALDRLHPVREGQQENR